MSPGKEKCITASQLTSTRRNKSWDFQGSYSLRSHMASTFTVCFTHSLTSFSQVFSTELSFLLWRFHTFFCLQLFQSVLFASDGCVQLTATQKTTLDYTAGPSSPGTRLSKHLINLTRQVERSQMNMTSKGEGAKLHSK